jgi:hypothetical protein
MEEYDALVDLKRSVDRQIELQEETNAIMRGMIHALQAVAQETQELREELAKRS